jgi:hypothetical protein
MPKKTFTPEQILAKLRQIEALVGQGKRYVVCEPASGRWRCRRLHADVKHYVDAAADAG